MVTARSAGMRCICLLAILLLTGRTVFAQPIMDESPGYEAEMTVANVTPALILASGYVFETAPVLEASLGAYLLGGPIVHTIHGNYGRAAASLGLRVGLPTLGLLAGMLVAGDPQPWNFDGPPSPWWIGGVSAGLIAAMVVDAKVLAKGHPRPATTSVAPTLSASPGGVSLGVAGAF